MPPDPGGLWLKKQLELLKKYGYQVVTVQRLMEYSPFADVGREDPGFEKLVRLQKTRGLSTQTTGCGWTPL